MRLLKTLRPDIKIVLGGPEVSFEVDSQEICRLADHVITGWGDVSFPKLCRALLDGPQPLMKVIAGEQPPLAELALPYHEYTTQDLAKRLLYVEASRGCPFKCEFCLSSLDKTAWAFELDTFMAEMDALYQRGARNFKFVDRTFNLKVDFSVRILQFEVGIQSFNPDVQQRISRKQDNARTADNLRWLVGQSQAHVHADLIFGLPGETLESFADGFDKLFALAPHEIQFGILKRLRGTPITRHTAAYAMVYDPQTPYTVLQTGVVNFTTMQRVKRFARYWEMVANSGRFTSALRLLLTPGSAFHHFLNFSDWLWQTTGKTHEFALEKLVDLLHEHLTAVRGLTASEAGLALLADYRASGARGRPHCLSDLLGSQKTAGPSVNGKLPGGRLAERQARHVSQHAHREEIKKAAAAA